MQPQRETLTDSLANIIQILQIGYRSGTLSVERDAGQAIEEGYIVFVNGRAVDARTHQYSGMVAFNYLQTWGSCRFSFINAGDTSNQPPFGASPFNHTTLRPSSGPPASTDVQRRAAHSSFPRRSPAGEAALAHPESAHIQRIHRRLLLLVNGRRYVSELARLLALNPEEVQTLLDTLEQEGLIQQ